MHTIQILDEDGKVIYIALVSRDSNGGRTTFEIGWKNTMNVLHQQNPKVGFPVTAIIEAMRHQGWQIILLDTACVIYN